MQEHFHPIRQLGRQGKKRKQACIKRQVPKLPYERNPCSCRKIKHVNSGSGRIKSRRNQEYNENNNISGKMLANGESSKQ